MAANVTRLQEEIKNIPLVDDEAQENEKNAAMIETSSRPCLSALESSPISFKNESSNPPPSNMIIALEPELSPDEAEEKSRLISQVLELQNTLEDLSQRVDSVKEENLKLKSENLVLGQYIENLMSASSVFQSTSPKARKK